MGNNTKALEQLAKIARNQQQMLDKLAQNRPIDRRFKPAPIIDNPYKPAPMKVPTEGFNTVLPPKPLSKKVIDEPEITTRPDVNLTKKEQEEAIQLLLRQNEQEQEQIMSQKIESARIKERTEQSKKPLTAE